MTPEELVPSEIYFFSLYSPLLVGVGYTRSIFTNILGEKRGQVLLVSYHI